MTMKTNSVGLIPLARRWDRLSPVLCAIVVASTLLAAASLSARGRETAGGIQGSAMEGPLAAHPPISIEGDAGFTPANGVTRLPRSGLKSTTPPPRLSSGPSP